MATLKDLDELLSRLVDCSRGMSLEQFKAAVLVEVKNEFRGDKIYVPAARDSKKDQIEAAARTLPSGVVAVRLGVSARYVRRVAYKK